MAGAQWLKPPLLLSSICVGEKLERGAKTWNWTTVIWCGAWVVNTSWKYTPRAAEFLQVFFSASFKRHSFFPLPLTIFNTKAENHNYKPALGVRVATWRIELACRFCCLDSWCCMLCSHLWRRQPLWSVPALEDCTSLLWWRGSQRNKLRRIWQNSLIFWFISIFPNGSLEGLIFQIVIRELKKCLWQNRMKISVYLGSKNFEIYTCGIFP